MINSHFTDNERKSYTSTFNQKYKSNNNINEKLNSFQTNSNHINNYSYDTIFEAYPVNTRSSHRDSDNNLLLSGSKMIQNGGLSSSEFIYNQYKESAQKKKQNINTNSNGNINNQFNTITNNNLSNKNYIDSELNNSTKLQNMNFNKNFSNTNMNNHNILYNPNSGKNINTEDNSDKVDFKDENNLRMQQLMPLGMNRVMPLNTNNFYDNQISYPVNTRFNK